MRRYQARQCQQTQCGLRFPVAVDQGLGELCPRCNAPTRAEGPAYHSEEAREMGDRAPGVAVEVLVDNVRSLRNVGSMFRTADGAGISVLHLGGFTPTPEHPKLAKTSLGAERSVAWTYARDGLARAHELRTRGCQLWAIEGGPRSRPVYELAPPRGRDTLVLVVGHEVSGIDPRIMELCEQVVRVPMLGIKGSLNVSVAFGIVAYHLRFATSVE